MRALNNAIPAAVVIQGTNLRAVYFILIYKWIAVFRSSDRAVAALALYIEGRLTGEQLRNTSALRSFM